MVSVAAKGVSLIEFYTGTVKPLLTPEVVYTHNANFHKARDRWRGCPPWGDSKSGTSFAVFPKDGGFFDAHNGFGGDALIYLYSMKRGRYEIPKGRAWVEALKDACQLVGVEMPDTDWQGDSKKCTQRYERQNLLFFLNQYLSEVLWSSRGEKSRDELHKRGLSDDQIKDFGIGFYPNTKEIRDFLISKRVDAEFAQACGVLAKKWEGYITFPWNDANGQPLTLYGHQSKEWAEATGKPKKYALFNPKGDDGEAWLHTKESPLYLDRALAGKHAEVVLCEGVLDAAVAQAKGLTQTVACVAAQLSKDQAVTLKRVGISQVTIALDPDAAGDRGIESCIRSLIEVGITPFVAPKLPDGLDPDEFILDRGVEEFQKLIDSAVHGFRWKAQQIHGNGDSASDKGRADILKKSAEFRNQFQEHGLEMSLYFDDELSRGLNQDLGKVRESLEKQCKDIGEPKPEKPTQSWCAKNLVEPFRPHLAWNIQDERWYRYGVEIEGVWTIENKEFVKQMVIDELDKDNIAYSDNFVVGIVNLLKSKLAVRDWDELEGCLPFLNGVLDLETRELKPHAPGNRLTWALPYDYNPKATCDPIRDWLLEIVDGDRAQLQLLRAWLNAVVKGRSDLQRFLELVGPGGTGKSTFLRLATALVGTRNTHTTTLQKLETSRFEPASLYNKRLVLVTDSERWAGGVSLLKALTGEDEIPYEVKREQSKGGFVSNAIVLLAANEIIQSSDYTSGLGRRRCSLWLTKQVPVESQRNLLKVDKKITGEFAPYIPGLLNWVLEMSDDEVKSYCKNTKVTVPSLERRQQESLLDINPIAAWADRYIITDPSGKTNVGVAQRDKDHESQTQFLNTERWLYASYCEYSYATQTKPVSVHRFSKLLEDLLLSQLKLTGIRRGKDAKGSYFEGIALRHDGDDHSPSLIVVNDDHQEVEPQRPYPEYKTLEEQHLTPETKPVKPAHLPYPKLEGDRGWMLTPLNPTTELLKSSHFLFTNSRYFSLDGQDWKTEVVGFDANRKYLGSESHSILDFEVWVPKYD